MSAGPRTRALALALAACAWTGAARAEAPGTSVLPVTLVDVATGTPVVIEPGTKVLHVVVFATWCRPCEDEIPALAEWEARFGASGYRLLIVAVSRRQSRERLARFVSEARPPGRLYFDPSGSFERSLGVDGLPAHVLLDAQGRVRLAAGSLAEVDVGALERMLAARGEDAQP